MEFIPYVLPGSQCASCSSSSGFESRDICTCICVHVFVESSLQNTQVFLQFRCVCLILSFTVLFYWHKVKAQYGGSGFTSETKSLNLVLFDIGRLTLKEKGLIGLFSFVFSRSDVTQIDIMPKSN